MEDSPIIILLAEDDQDDQYLISEALDESNVPHKLFIVENGEELLDYIHNRNQYLNKNKYPRPELILLDLNMPRKNGMVTLKEIKSDPKFKRIPVVALTTSQSEEDIIQTYELGVSSYITKPMTFTALVEMMKSLGKYWEGIVKLPPD